MEKTIADVVKKQEGSYLFYKTKNPQPTPVWMAEAELPDKKHSHYFKDVSKLDSIDVYQVLLLFEVTDPCIQHAVKKLLCSGSRGVKSAKQDVQEALDTLNRYMEIHNER